MTLVSLRVRSIPGRYRYSHRLAMTRGAVFANSLMRVRMLGREWMRISRNSYASWSHRGVRFFSIPLFRLVTIPRHVLADSLRPVLEVGTGADRFLTATRRILRLTS